MEEPHGECGDEDLASTGGNVEKCRLESIETKVFDDQRVLDADTTDEIGKCDEKHENVCLWIGDSLDESIIDKSLVM